MLERRGETGGGFGDEEMAEAFQGHLERVRDWLEQQGNIQTAYVNYADVVADASGLAHRINDFLGVTLDVERMAEVVDPSLYRQRR
jgi:hypothetical protein